MIFRYVPNWVADSILGLMIVGYLIIGWHWLQSAQSNLEPGQGKVEYIKTPIIHVGEPFQLSITTAVDQSKCQVVSERHIMNNEGHEVYSKWVMIPKPSLEKLRDGGTVILDVPLPKLTPGDYFYMSIIHLSCPGGTSYLRTTAYLPFKIIP